MKKSNYKKYNTSNRYKSQKRSVWLTVFVLFVLVVISFLVVCAVWLFKTHYKKPDEQIEISQGEMQIVDANGQWTTSTQIQLFKSHYENGEVTTVIASNGSSTLVAPGTSNEYVFQLVNSGDTTLDYNVNIRFSMSQSWEDITIPIQIKLLDGDGNSLFKNNSWIKWANAPNVSKTGVLDIDKNAQFVLRWEWPFESDDDFVDTFLGNMSKDEDLVLLVDIQVTAKDSAQQNGRDAGKSLWWLWLLLIVFAILLLIVLILKVTEKDNKQDNNRRKNKKYTTNNYRRKW